MEVEKVCEGQFCLLDKGFMNLGVFLNENLTLNLAKSFLSCEN